MLRRTLTLLALLGLIGPLAARPDDWDGEWEEDYTNQPPYQGDQGYDVSVDMSVSGAVTLDTFQGALSPYGDWVVAGGYGRVWRPHVAAGWRPYYYGRWEWTNEGWLWASDEPFGWAAYHYGRWTYDSYYGWLWVPGYQWAPAWVAWRYSGDVVGWAPLGPGVSVYVSSYPFVDQWWTFVPCGSFVSVPVYSVAYAPSYTRRYFYATAPAPPVARGVRPAPGRPGVASPAWGGPAPRVIEQRIGRSITPVRVVPSATPGAARAVRPGEVSVYRPEMRSAPIRGGGATPRGAPGAAPGTERGAIVPGPGTRGPGAAPSGPYAPPARGGERGAPAPGAQPPGRGGERPEVVPPPSRGGSRPAPTPQGRDGAGYAPPGRGAPYGSAAPYGSGAPARAPSRGEGWSGGAARAPQEYAPPAARSQGYAPPAGRPQGYAAPAGRSQGYAAPSRGAEGYAPAARSGGAPSGRPAPAARGGGRGREVPGRAER